MAIAANKRLGQNFLSNKGIIEKIIAAAALTPRDTILEIGPGLGAITLPLAARAKKIIAVEKDPRLVEALGSTLTERHIANVDIIPGDIMHLLETHTLPLPEHYSVVANIPYYLTSALIRTLLEREQKPQRMLLMIQKEVAQRIAARDGKESILSLAVKFYADAQILFFVSRGSFTPAPKVDSAIIEITPHEKMPDIDPEAFFTIMKAGFSAPRKKLIGNLASKLRIDREIIAATFSNLDIDHNTRSEQLTLSQWIDLARNLRAMVY